MLCFWNAFFTLSGHLITLKDLIETTNFITFEEIFFPFWVEGCWELVDKSESLNSDVRYEMHMSLKSNVVGTQKYSRINPTMIEVPANILHITSQMTKEQF